MPSAEGAPPTPPGPRARLRIPRWLTAASVLLLVLTLVLLIAAVEAGLEGDIDLSNALAVGSLLGMASFAGLNLSQQRSLAGRLAN